MDAVASATASSAALNVRFCTTRGQGSAVGSILHIARFFAYFVALRALHKCDVLHLNVASRGSTRRKAFLAATARWLNVPYVVHLHGAEYREFFAAARPATRRQVTRLFNRAAQVIVLGTVWRDFVIAENLAFPDRISVLANATPPRRVLERKANPTVRIVFLGVLNERKGVPQLVEALGYLSRLKDWSAVLAGNGSVESTAAALAERGLAGRVTVPGWLDPSAVDALLAEADILVLPSFAENLPMSVIEGMAAGLAIVTTPVGGIPDIIAHGETGLLIAPGDVAALTAALRKLVTSPAERARLGANARHFHKEHLELTSYVMQLEEIWRKARDR
jgi:glycosyltransferase involved in cell wall biosynthesis